MKNTKVEIVYRSERRTKMQYSAAQSIAAGHCFESWVQNLNQEQSVFCVETLFWILCNISCTVLSVQSTKSPQCAVIRVFVVQGVTVLWWSAAAVKRCRGVVSDKSDFCAAKWNLMAARPGKG